MNWDLEENRAECPSGFVAAAVEAGVKYKNRLDLTLVSCPKSAAAAALFTTNQVKAAPVLLSAERLGQNRGKVNAILFNSGCANAATGTEGMEAAKQTTALIAELLKVSSNSVLVASTGVIGVQLPVEKICAASQPLVKKLSPSGLPALAQAILTTDTKTKTATARCKVNGETVTVVGVAKGSGMIHPNMATLLALILTDARVEPATLKKCLQEAADRSFHRISVDGDTSTNDSLFCLASGESKANLSPKDLTEGLLAVAKSLAIQIVKDGEGAKKLIQVSVLGAKAEKDAELVAKTVASSLLVRTAIAGGDPNWGRILAAVGRSGVGIDLEKMTIRVEKHILFQQGKPIAQITEPIQQAFQKEFVPICVELGLGQKSADYWTCDLTEGYIHINADYTT